MLINGTGKDLCDAADVSSVHRQLMAGRQFLNSHAVEGLNYQKALQDTSRDAHNMLLTSGNG
ncbi:hypothetical protein FVA81_06880 [Rhizobium sp. WL3]|uniref:hypothetical protein n=1 Tax=Rhizobium sp. WL3 TaxID=2603277 RepID=UPI0011C1D24C|nr:hypothetical protein [Rhizobium sp. WL3]QEE44350.1 hypothetical protein FVA81_06880 [Rhizobium sp. WL3]